MPRSHLDASVRSGISRRLNALLLVESNLWFLTQLGGPGEIPPYAVRYDLAASSGIARTVEPRSGLLVSEDLSGRPPV